MALDYDPNLLRISWGYWTGNDKFLGMGALVSSIFYNLFSLIQKLNQLELRFYLIINLFFRCIIQWDINYLKLFK